MQNGSITACSGTFYDSGGGISNYGDNEDIILTICPENVGDRVKLEFQEFETQLNFDVMTIYDGNSIDNTVISEFSGVDFLDTIVASLDNQSGCLTIRFVSDGNNTAVGWSANISCLVGCQDIIAELSSINPMPNSDGIVEVCIGDSINVNGSATFSNDGTGATYNWVLGNGITMQGESVSFSYNNPGVYLVNLLVYDTNTDNYTQGCSNSNTINQIIRVSGAPSFEGTQANNDVLCFGESTTIDGEVTPLTLIYNCPPPISDLTFLPDGNGAVYSTCINVVCFEPDDLLTDVSQIQDICLNMEHSYVGDLYMKIISPNGQEAILKSYPGGGGNYLGLANDDNTTNPGIGLDYCFSMAGDVTLVNGPTLQVGNNVYTQYIEPGTYLPDESFEQLVGSPLNGEWCIEIVDNLAIDNGYIFSWELNFDESVPQEDFAFVPNIVSQSWDYDPSITQINGNSITVSPNSSGEHCYTYRVIDIFGCEFEEEVCITVADLDQAPVTYYLDSDNDGYGDPNSFIIECLPNAPNGYSINDFDCDDLNAEINPDAPDSVGNNIDENCDGVDGDSLSIEEHDSKKVLIYPNPFITSINIDLLVGNNGREFEVRIYDLNGRLVNVSTHINQNGTIKINNLNKLEKAIYFIRITNNEMNLDVVKRILKI